MTFLVLAGAPQPASSQAEPVSKAPMGDACCMAGCQDGGHHTNHGFAWKWGQNAQVSGHFETVFSAFHILLQNKIILK